MQQKNEHTGRAGPARLVGVLVTLVLAFILACGTAAPAEPAAEQPAPAQPDTPKEAKAAPKEAPAAPTAVPQSTMAPPAAMVQPEGTLNVGLKEMGPLLPPPQHPG